MSLSQNNIFNYPFTIEESIYNFNIFCENNEINDTTQNFLYKVDTRQPRINISGITDEQVFNLNDILNYVVVFEDENLFAYNVTILTALGVIWDGNQFFLQNISSTTASNTSSITLDETGNYSIVFESWDSHTKKKIKNYKVKKDKDNKKIEFGNLSATSLSRFQSSTHIFPFEDRD